MYAVDAYLQELSSDHPTPGGGSVAALQVAMGAALLAMVANITLKRGGPDEERVRAMRDRAYGLRDRAVQLAADDEAAYGEVVASLELPRLTREERADRARRIQAALQGAVIPPQEVIMAAAGVLSLACDLIDASSFAIVSDIGVATTCASAGYLSARLNVEINMSASKNAEWTAEAGQRLATAPDVESEARNLLARVDTIIRSRST